MENWREQVIEEAQTWLLTPWHHLADVKGAGVDCAQFLRKVYINVGLAEPFETDAYPMDFMMNRSEERFLKYIEQYMDKVDKPLPGDAAVFMYGRCFSHGAIVIEWPLVIHAYRKERCVTWGDASKCEFKDREVRFYTPRIK